MANQENNATATNEARTSLRVYRKDGKWGYWYSATRSDGKSINVVFDKDLEVPDLKAFEISEVTGTLKQKVVEKDKEVYENYTYFISGCTFSKIVGGELPL